MDWFLSLSSQLVLSSCQREVNFISSWMMIHDNKHNNGEEMRIACGIVAKCLHLFDLMEFPGQALLNCTKVEFPAQALTSLC